MSFDGLATNNPPHGRITSETVGVVYVLITTKATKHRLTEVRPVSIHPSDVPFIVPPIAIINLIIILESALRPSEIIVYLGNAG